MARCLIASSVCASKKSCGRAKNQYKRDKEYVHKYKSAKQPCSPFSTKICNKKDGNN